MSVEIRRSVAVSRVASTVAFYAVMLQPSMRGTVLYHYTTEHAVEYVVVALFFWGLWDVVLKFLSFPRQLAALRQEWLPPRTVREPVENAAVGPLREECPVGQRVSVEEEKSAHTRSLVSATDNAVRALGALGAPGAGARVSPNGLSGCTGRTARRLRIRSPS